MSGRKKKLHSELASISSKLAGLVEEARYKEPDARTKETEERTLTKSLTSLREQELNNERHFDRRMEEVEASKAEREKNQLEETKNLRIKKEIQLQLLDASKIELERRKKDMNKLKESKINLLKEMAGYNNNMNMNNQETETSAKDVDEMENMAANLGLQNERQTVEEIEKSLSDLKKKTVQLVSVARTERDILTRKIAYLREITAKRANFKKEIEEFEKKEKEKKSAEMKGNGEKSGNKVAGPVRETEQFELSEIEEDQLRSLEEEITKTELEHKAVLLEIDQVLGSKTGEGREKVADLRTRLELLREKVASHLSDE